METDNREDVKYLSDTVTELHSLFVYWKDARKVDRDVAWGALLFLAAQQSVWDRVTKEAFLDAQAVGWDQCKKMFDKFSSTDPTK